MDAFISTYVWPLLIMIGQSLLLLVALLVFIAYILLADRKVWAAVQLRRGPNVVGPWGLFQSFADLLKFVFKEPVFNYSADFQFVWDETKLPIRYGSDLAKAEQIVLEAIAGELGAIGPATRQEWDKLVRKFRIENARLEPWVSVALTDNWISLSARFIVDYRARRSTKDRINRAILSAIDSSGGAVRIGTATMEVTSFRGD